MIMVNDLKKNSFQQMDDEGRLKFQGFCMGQEWCTYNRSASDEYSSWDVSYYSGYTSDSSIPIIGEIKDRRLNINTYDSYFFEVKKFVALKKVRRDLMKKYPNKPAPMIHYINFFSDYQMLVWDVTHLDLDNVEVQEIALQRTECGDRDEIMKQTILLPINNAIINTSKNGKNDK